MSNSSNINTKLPAEGLKHKRVRMSSCLQKCEQKGQVENLPTDSQLVGPPTSIAHTLVKFFSAQTNLIPTLLIYSF